MGISTLIKSNLYYEKEIHKFLDQLYPNNREDVTQWIQNHIRSLDEKPMFVIQWKGDNSYRFQYGQTIGLLSIQWEQWSHINDERFGVGKICIFMYRNMNLDIALLRASFERIKAKKRSVKYYYSSRSPQDKIDDWEKFGFRQAKPLTQDGDKVLYQLAESQVWGPALPEGQILLYKKLPD